MGRPSAYYGYKAVDRDCVGKGGLYLEEETETSGSRGRRMEAMFFHHEEIHASTACAI